MNRELHVCITKFIQKVLFAVSRFYTVNKDGFIASHYFLVDTSTDQWQCLLVVQVTG